MPQTSDPFFSVILPVYNGERYLSEAIDSVLAQTFESWELVLVDDVSTDTTPEIIARYVAKDPRIRTIRNAVNVNCGPSANNGIRVSRGSWITRIDADDHYKPGYLAALKDEIGRREGDFFLSTWVTIIDDAGNAVVDVQVPDGEKVKRMMGIENFIYHPATSYPKELWEKVGGYPAVQKEADDRVLWGKFFNAGIKLHVVPRALMEYRIHTGNISFVLEQNGFYPTDVKTLRSLRTSGEWKASLLLKNGRSRDARAMIATLRKQDGQFSAKNGFFVGMTYLPAQAIRFFMWNVRPHVRAWMKSAKKKS